MATGGVLAGFLTGRSVRSGDDVVIRVRAAGGGSRIDIRSASRFGSHDFGANAKRVAGLLEDIDDASSPERTERPVKKPAKTPPVANTPQPTRR